MNLILASTSIYRKELLSRLRLPFATAAPEVDETPMANENPDRLVRRLAEAKALDVASRFPDARIIGSDQVAVVDGRILGKPGNHQCAVEQLRRASGRRLEFLTGLCLYNASTKSAQLDVVPYAVVFRTLTDSQIENYLSTEQPYHCAGAFKSEALGIVLCERFEGGDPTALIGLPLIRLTAMLAKEGIAVV
jgi:septum formation protein